MTEMTGKSENWPIASGHLDQDMQRIDKHM